jgi:hypothetical protein
MRPKKEERTLFEHEYKALLARIAPLCGGVAGEVVAVEDYKLLCLLAKRHSVTNLLYLASKDDPALPDDLRRALENMLFTSMRQQLSQEYEAERVFAALEKAGIRFLPMKGIVLRPLYPKPEMRISCDVDVFYDKAERARVGAIMAELGYEPDGADANHEGFKKGMVSIEMHHNLMTHFETVDAYYDNIWERLIPVSDYRYQMSDEDFYIYATVHTMKHFAVGGTGIRSVLDVFVYLAAKPNLDMAYIERELQSIGLLEFHRTFLQLADAYFGGKALPSALQDVSDYILGSGTYGVFSQSVANIAASRKGGKLGFYLRRAFPAYRLMAEKYPSLRRFPPALPVYWAYRLCVAAFGREHQLGREVRAVNSLDKAEQKRLDGIMAQVGLRGYH